MNAPQRHHRHREEPKARPLRVGDTEKPGPEGKQSVHTLFSQCLAVPQFFATYSKKDNSCWSVFISSPVNPQHPHHPTTVNAPTMKRLPTTTITRSSRRWIDDIECFLTQNYSYFLEIEASRGAIKIIYPNRFFWDDSHDSVVLCKYCTYLQVVIDV